jgi:hypothetical protein
MKLNIIWKFLFLNSGRVLPLKDLIIHQRDLNIEIGKLDQLKLLIIVKCLQAPVDMVHYVYNLDFKQLFENKNYSQLKDSARQKQ